MSPELIAKYRAFAEAAKRFEHDDLTGLGDALLEALDECERLKALGDTEHMAGFDDGMAKGMALNKASGLRAALACARKWVRKLPTDDLSDAATQCREEQGPCWCGFHIAAHDVVSSEE